MSRKYTFDISKCFSPEDIHSVIADEFDLPEYYGGNLDALHDVLTDVSDPVEITFVGTETASVVIGEKFIRSLKRMCEAAAKENDKLTIVFED